MKGTDWLLNEANKKKKKKDRSITMALIIRGSEKLCFYYERGYKKTRMSNSSDFVFESNRFSFFIYSF